MEDRNFKGVSRTRLSLISRSADFGRIIGASVVFYGHIGIFTGYPLWQWGEYAVAFFILLSGVAYTGFSSAKPIGFASYKRYITARVGAIFPTFLIINCGIFAASFCYPSAAGRPFTFTEFLLSSGGLSQYCGHRYLSAVMWFVPFIVQAYILFPPIDAILNRISAPLVILAAFAVSLSLIVLVFMAWPLHATEICRNWSVVFRLPEVCVGLILGRCTLRRSDFRGGSIALATFALLSFTLATAFSSRFGHSAYIISLPWNGLIVTLVISAASISAAAMLGNSNETQVLRLAGKASFPFFLAHGIAILFVFRRFGTLVTPWVLYFAFCWCAAIIFTGSFRYAARTRAPAA